MDFRTYSELYHHGVKGMHWGVRKKYEPHPVIHKPKKMTAYEMDKAKLDKVRKGLKIAGHVARLVTLSTPIVGALLKYKAHGIPLKSVLTKEELKLFGEQMAMNYIRNAPQLIKKMAVQTVATKGIDMAIDYGLKKKHGINTRKSSKVKKRKK